MKQMQVLIGQLNERLMGANLVFPTDAMAATCEFRSVIMPQMITAANNEENLYFIHLFRAH